MREVLGEQHRRLRNCVLCASPCGRSPIYFRGAQCFQIWAEPGVMHADAVVGSFGLVGLVGRIGKFAFGDRIIPIHACTLEPQRGDVARTERDGIQYSHSAVMHTN